MKWPTKWRPAVARWQRYLTSSCPLFSNMARARLFFDDWLRLLHVHVHEERVKILGLRPEARILRPALLHNVSHLGWATVWDDGPLVHSGVADCNRGAPTVSPGVAKLRMWVLLKLAYLFEERAWGFHPRRVSFGRRSRTKQYLRFAKKHLVSIAIVEHSSNPAKNDIPTEYISQEVLNSVFPLRYSGAIQ